MGSIIKFIVTATLLTLITQLSMADVPKGKISGYITDEDTGEPLIGVNVLINGTSQGAATSLDGKYLIINVDPGIYSLQIQMIGYARTSIPDVKVLPGKKTTINAELPTKTLSSSSGGDVVKAIKIAKLPPYLPLLPDSVYMVADTSKRGKYTVPIFVVNTTETAWRIPTVDWYAFITPVVSKEEETFEYITNRSAFCGNSAFGSTLPANSYEIYRQPYRTPEHPSDSIHYELRLTEPIRNYQEGKFLFINSAEYPGSISEYELNKAMWGRDYIGSLSQSELRDVLQDKIEIPPAYELRAKTGAITSIDLRHDELWLSGFDKLKYYYYKSEYCSPKERIRFLEKVELKIKLKYIKELERKLDIDDFSQAHQVAYYRLMVGLTENEYKARHRHKMGNKAYNDILQSKGLTSKNEYLRASAIERFFDPRIPEDATESLFQMLETESSNVVKYQLLNALSNRYTIPKGDSLKILLGRIVKYDDPNLRYIGYRVLRASKDQSMQGYINSVTNRQIQIETDWNKSVLLLQFYHRDSLDTESIQLLSDLANSKEGQIRWRLSSVVVKQLKTLFRHGLEEDPQSEALINIIAVLAMDDIRLVQDSALGIHRFGMHDERVLTILQRAQLDMKSDFPKEIADKIQNR